MKDASDIPDTFLRAHRQFLCALAGGIVAFMLWVYFAKLDIVIVTQGKLVPDGFVQVIQAPEEGRVVRILVQDGERVAAGQALAELDALSSLEDASSAKAEVQSLQDRMARTQGELTGAEPAVSNPQVRAEYLQRRAMQDALLVEALRVLEQAKAEQLTAAERRHKYEALLPVAKRQVDMLAQLRTGGFVSEAAINDKMLNLIDTERELGVQVRAESTAAAQVRAAQASLVKVNADYRRQLSIEQTDAQLKLRQAEANLSKHEHRAGLQVLRAPVAGSITGIKVHSSGQVVGLGATLLSLVPEGQPLCFEGWLRNEDSAFVVPGMPSKVKLAAYPFQKYGWLEGEMTWVGVDSETPESMRNAQGEPLFYRVRVKLPQQALHLNGKPLALKPGMQAVGDLQIGSRTIFEYLTSPLRKIAMEAARER